MPAYKDKQRNTWSAQFSYKDWTGETKRCMKRGFSTKREALQWEREFLLQKSGSVDMTFRNFVQVYWQDRGPRLKESTSATKENIIDTKILPYFGDKKLRDISSTDIIQWQNAMIKGADPASGRHYAKSYLKTLHNQLSAILNHAVKFYGLGENPARTVGNMGTDRDTTMKFWTKDEYLKFSEVMMDEPVAYYCFETLYWCGIRLGELLALTAEDLDLVKGTMNIDKTYQHIKGKDIITDPKTPKSKRVVKIPSFLCEELSDYMDTLYDLKPGDRLFPVTKSYLHRQMAKGCQALNVEKIRIHDLRHSHVSLLISLGYSAVAIADRVGHESIDITYRYAHLFPTTQEAMINSLEQAREEV